MSETTRHHRDDVLVVAFTRQRILADAVIAQIGRELLELADEADSKLLLNFQGVTFMSSAMIDKLVLLSKKCAASKIVVKMCAIAPNIREVFEITRLNKMFSIYDSENDAFKAFSKKSWLG